MIHTGRQRSCEYPSGSFPINKLSLRNKAVCVNARNKIIIRMIMSNQPACRLGPHINIDIDFYLGSSGDYKCKNNRDQA